MEGKDEHRLFHYLFVAMGAILLGVCGWIGVSVAHIPSIDTKLDDFMSVANGTLSKHDARLDEHDRRLSQHELRLHDLEIRGRK